MKKKAGVKLITLLLCFVLAVCAVTAALSVGAIKYAYPVKYEDYVEKYAAMYDVPEELLFAVIRTESSFKPEAVSSAGALGLTQITPEMFHGLRTRTGGSHEACCSTSSAALRLPSPLITPGAEE